MANVYLLNAPEIPEFSLIRETLEPYYPLTVADSWAKLAQELADQREAVVVFASPPDKISLQAAQIRALLPTAACVCVNTQEDVQQLPGYQFDADFLLLPLTRFEILSRISTASRQSELRANMEAAAQMDEGTQLYNQRYFMNRLNEEISLSKRHLTPLACMVIGIEYFQLYRDSYGYDFVNGLLKSIALIIRSHKRQEDIIARIGDDEVGLILSRSTEKGAKPLADRIVKAIQSAPYRSGPNRSDEITETLSAHAGIAGYPLVNGTEADADAIVRYARHALHNARCGTGRPVEIFSEIKPAV